MAAGTRISITTTKATYDIYDSVDNVPSIDDKALVPRYQIRRNGTPVVNGVVPPVAAAGFIKFTRALKEFYQMVRYYERR